MLPIAPAPYTMMFKVPRVSEVPMAFSKSS